MKNIKRALHISIVCAVVLMYQEIRTMTPDNTTDPLNRGLLIFLDNSEWMQRELGAITSSFIYAFDQEAAPIIVSASILDNVLRYEYEIPDKNPKKLQQLVDRLAFLPSKLYRSVIFYIIDFEKKLKTDWIIKKIHDSIYLLIPKKTLDTLKIQEEEAKKYTTEKTITAAEQTIGLKINHLKTVTDLNTIKTDNFAHLFARYLFDTFVKITEYNDINNDKIPHWAIYLMGHGKMKSGERDILIANMELTEFRNFLTFLVHHIRTKLLFNESCYSVGVNSNLALQGILGAAGTPCPFPIIVGGLVDSITYAHSISISIDRNGLFLKKYPSFSGLVTEMTKNIPDYKKLINFFLPSPTMQRSLAGLMPQIKYPGSSWFSVIDDDVVLIDSTLAITEVGPLNIEKLIPEYNKKRPIRGILYHFH